MADERADPDATERVPSAPGSSPSASRASRPSGSFDPDATQRVWSPDSEMPRAAGQVVFGRYTLEAEVGRGGMGVVWRARDQFNVAFALKMLPATLARDAVALDELEQETQRARRLRHPNIVNVFHLVQDETGSAVSMEFVDGAPLARLRLKEPNKIFTTEKLTPLVAQICSALEYAHAHAKVVHRDLKPANILVAASGTVKVVDFGIARSLAETHTRITGRPAGNVSGTLPYMSPQQLLGERPSVADDIYALGATLYELLTTKPPFHRGEFATLMVQIHERLPLSLAAQCADLEVAAPPVPKNWEETILACLAKDAAARPRSVSEVAARLGLAGAGATPSSAPVFDPNATIRVARPRADLDGKPIAEAGSPSMENSGQRSKGRAAAQGEAASAEKEKAAAVAKTKPSARATPEKLRSPEVGQCWTIPEINLDLMPIAPGTFMMGSPDDEPDRVSSEGPQTRVTISRPFWLGRTAVTQAQWQAVMGITNERGPKMHGVGADYPIYYVSWNDVMRFCRRLTKSERAAGRLPKGYVYTLPTEAQWEYACRAGTTGAYAGDLDEMAWYDQNSGMQSHPVGTKRANAWGLLDMHGNVFEWCLNYSGDYPGGSVTDYAGPESGIYRVTRGGCMHNPAEECRAAGRSAGKPGDRSHIVGFRLALSVVGPAAELDGEPAAESRKQNAERRTTERATTQRKVIKPSAPPGPPQEDNTKQIAEERAQVRPDKQPRDENSLKLSIRSDEVEITHDAVRYNRKTLPASDINGLKFGVFKQYINGINTSTSYLISARSVGHGTIDIECKRAFRSEEQAQADYQQILQSLYLNIVPGLCERVATQIAAGKEVAFASWATNGVDWFLSSKGMRAKTGAFFWKKEELISWGDVRFGFSEGKLNISSASDSNAGASFSLREVWNAAIFKELTSTIITALS